LLYVIILRARIESKIPMVPTEKKLAIVKLC
jgi:hypothetical protein